ncbi:MAG: Gfo/Idh/MocA family oxidoreductase [Bauldia sp.]|nr:Gfo/Idh/MocA family oxidoreductase [Bauldia sp.]
MARDTRIGIIGCGNISDTYFSFAPLFKGLAVVACADLKAPLAKAKAEKYGVRAETVDGLLKSDDVDLVINLTIPAAHFSVTQAILSAGKHAYSEKPLALGAADARKLLADAERRGLKLGGAPDTFLGPSAQVPRRLIDKGTIGAVIAGTAYVMSHGMEHWHPNPGFFYKPGAGPVFDIGPYYITTLVSLLGPVRGVVAMARKGFAERRVSAEGPMKGKAVKVTTPTTINAVLDFASGAQITLGASWDVWKHGHSNPIELYGEKGSMLVPDPNFFGGQVAWSAGNDDYAVVDTSDEVFGVPNWPASGPNRANYRMLGVADMVDAIRKNREPRCSGRLTAHVVDVMESILRAAAERKHIRIRSTTDRPAPLTAADAKRLLA